MLIKLIRNRLFDQCFWENIFSVFLTTSKKKNKLSSDFCLFVLIYLAVPGLGCGMQNLVP